MWPTFTPWNGKYDYNHWTLPTVRYGCTIPPGIYIGIQRDYADVNPIPASSEQRMLNTKFDDDGCLNGEAQVLLRAL
jgi:hypothetical protein